MDADHADVKKDYGNLTRADAQGHYSFSALPPGRYLLAVNLTPIPRTERSNECLPTHVFSRRDGYHKGRSYHAGNR
jgi:hypothetical protein